MTDKRLGALVLGAAVGGLLGLWIFGVWGAIFGACLGGAVAVGMLERQPI